LEKRLNRKPITASRAEIEEIQEVEAQNLDYLNLGSGSFNWATMEYLKFFWQRDY